MMLRKQNWWSALQVAIMAGCVLSARASYAQVLTPDIPKNRPLLLVEEQYRQGLYALSQQSARQYLNDLGGAVFAEKPTDIEKAKYYIALSALKTGAPGCADSALDAMNSISNPAYNQRINFSLAQYYFQHDQFPKAIPLYETASNSNLDKTELSDKDFELAYCYFNNKQFTKAEPLLRAIIELKDGKYYKAGNYYYGLLSYNENKYKAALQSFDKIKDAREYKSVVPYYIAEIYYFMGEREKALKLANDIIASREKSYYDKELHLLAAQCLFEDQKYADARPYFEYYYDHADKIRKQDLYEMAYCDYRTSDWAKAIEKFKMLNNSADSLGQTAMYLLGDCYLNLPDMQSARNAFGLCADMSFNKIQQEASMMLYARISYETEYDDEALRQLNLLLKTFPYTQYKDEANTLISGLLVKTNKYDEALKHLEDVSRKDEGYWPVFQKATYGFAVQQFRSGDLGRAYKYFDLSLQHPVNGAYESAALFWKSEIAYRQHHYTDVITFSQEFVSRKNERAVSHISPLATAQHAYLNMGYAAMETKNFSAAQNYFSHAQQEHSQDTYSGMVAILREADAVFMQKNYSRAISLYDKIIATDTADADYARYQKSILLGLMGKNNEKISLLQSLINSDPPSPYANHARYDVALTYIESDKYPQALGYLRQLADSVSDKSFAPQAWMKIGFINQQINENGKAIAAYKHVVIDYPASEDRLAALDALKSLYIQGNQPAAYTQLLRANNLPSADSSSLDSTYYAAAESQFANGKFEDALTGFNNYLQQYPQGIFAIKARYYRAESNYQLRNFKEARADYDVILSGAWNDFFENSAKHAANIAYDTKDYTAAFNYYWQLRNSTSSDQTRALAYNGLVKSGYNSGKYRESAEYADSLLAIKGISAETTDDALYFKARSMQHYDSSAAVISLYRELSNNKNGEIAAESRYHIAEILFKQDKLKEAEEAANETIHKSAGYDYWIVRSYLLLSDILVKQKDYFNAKATLQSVAKHTKIEELKQEATKKLEEVNVLEKHKSKLSDE